ncbi:MAG TPA: hypothetical protein VFZ68_12565 [Acidimicrobiales bacterium]
MAKGATLDELKRGDRVRALDDLPGVPAGTYGRVYLVSGFTWTRYRVMFDNGVDIGSLDGSVLVRPKDYEKALERRRAAADEAEEAAASVDGDAEESPTAAGEGKVVNGVTVPAHLLERAKRARERVGAG